MAGRMICRSSPSSRLVAGWLLLSSCSLSMALHRSSNMLNISKETTKAHSCHAERHPPAIRASMIDTGKKKKKRKTISDRKKGPVVDLGRYWTEKKKEFSGGGPTRARCWRRLTNHLLAQPNGQFRSKLFILVCREREFLVASVASRPWPSVKPRGERERENIKKKSPKSPSSKTIHALLVRGPTAGKVKDGGAVGAPIVNWWNIACLSAPTKWAEGSAERYIPSRVFLSHAHSFLNKLKRSSNC